MKIGDRVRIRDTSHIFTYYPDKGFPKSGWFVHSITPREDPSKHPDIVLVHSGTGQILPARSVNPEDVYLEQEVEDNQ
jgi:hypothetical protein